MASKWNPERRAKFMATLAMKKNPDTLSFAKLSIDVLIRDVERTQRDFKIAVDRLRHHVETTVGKL